MQGLHQNGVFGDGSSRRAVLRYCWGLLLVVLPSCSTDLPVQRATPETGDAAQESRFSIVCVIHGDGEYLYHDSSGIEHLADEDALENAVAIARNNLCAEVFIFHQRPRRHVLFLFPRRDGEFYYFRNGQLVAEESYWRDQESSRVDPEVGLYVRFRQNTQHEMLNLFLYYGHEIPEYGGAGYDGSYPDRPFTVTDLANGLHRLTRNGARFDLVVLSTCFGGTPHSIGVVGAQARYIIASPENLHLSYLDLRSLARLDLMLSDGDVRGLARRVARDAFERLATRVQTTVSVAVYDVDRVQNFLDGVRGRYEETLNLLKSMTPVSAASVEHCDCAELPEYEPRKMGEGVEVYYRAARFGRSQHTQGHSGWECWREKGMRSTLTGGRNDEQ
jgi:hypothetical protein